MKRYGTSTDTHETVRYFNGTVNGIMDNAKMIIAASSLLQRHHDLENKLRSPTWRRCNSKALPIASLQSRKFLFELSRPTVLAVFEDLLLNFWTNFVRVSSMSASGNTDSSTV